MVRDADAWWGGVDLAALVAGFRGKAPRAPAVQPWGLKVGLSFDPSGVLWRVAEAPFQVGWRGFAHAWPPAGPGRVGLVGFWLRVGSGGAG